MSLGSNFLVFVSAQTASSPHWHNLPQNETKWVKWAGFEVLRRLLIELGVRHPSLVRLAHHQLENPALGEVHQFAADDVDAKRP